MRFLWPFQSGFVLFGRRSVPITTEVRPFEEYKEEELNKNRLINPKYETEIFMARQKRHGVKGQLELIINCNITLRLPEIDHYRHWEEALYTCSVVIISPVYSLLIIVVHNCEASE